MNVQPGRRLMPGEPRATGRADRHYLHLTSITPFPHRHSAAYDLPDAPQVAAPIVVARAASAPDLAQDDVGIDRPRGLVEIGRQAAQAAARNTTHGRPEPRRAGRGLRPRQVGERKLDERVTDLALARAHAGPRQPKASRPP